MNSVTTPMTSHNTEGLCQEIGPFVGFRSSVDGGHSWSEPKDVRGELLTVANPLFETLGQAVKLGAPHVVDHGPENMHSPDGAVYMVPCSALPSNHVHA
jgi:hypothetical protein